MAQASHLVEGRFEVHSTLGKGGYGRVLLATDSATGQKVALKQLTLDHPDAKARFRREARITASLQNPHLVKVLDSGLDPKDGAWIAYEFIQGRILTSARPARPEAVARWGVQLCQALQLAHDADIVHRDVKPANVLLDRNDRAILCDFGVAQSPDATVATATGVLLGTPSFMAPELYRGETASPATDQFALAATLYVILGGASAYPEQGLQGVLRSLREGYAPPADLDAHATRPDLAEALRRALHKYSEERFPSMRAFGEALEAVARSGGAGSPTAKRVGSETIQTRPPQNVVPQSAPTAVAGPVTPLQRLAQGAGTWRPLLLGGGIGCLLGALVLWWGAEPTPAPSPAGGGATTAEVEDLGNEDDPDDAGRVGLGAAGESGRVVLRRRLDEVPAALRRRVVAMDQRLDGAARQAGEWLGGLTLDDLGEGVPELGRDDLRRLRPQVEEGDFGRAVIDLMDALTDAVPLVDEVRAEVPGDLAEALRQLWFLPGGRVVRAYRRILFQLAKAADLSEVERELRPASAKQDDLARRDAFMRQAQDWIDAFFDPDAPPGTEAYLLGATMLRMSSTFRLDRALETLARRNRGQGEDLQARIATLEVDLLRRMTRGPRPDCARVAATTDSIVQDAARGRAAARIPALEKLAAMVREAAACPELADREAAVVRALEANREG